MFDRAAAVKNPSRLHNDTAENQFATTGHALADPPFSIRHSPAGCYGHIPPPLGHPHTACTLPTKRTTGKQCTTTVKPRYIEQSQIQGSLNSTYSETSIERTSQRPPKEKEATTVELSTGGSKCMQHIKRNYQLF